ncbi:MAG TPA: sigma-70 family RNA polymerase sigma factor [Vicinamibacteria bacterium]|nr:sigma-70 family RNA polymerase sigma factor [Vicinamibacteria bacterium]
MSAHAVQLEREFADHRSFLWSLLYRLCGDAADAEDLVQDTFVRALQHPPARTGEPWRPWLVRVAVNLGRDLLRRRRRRRYEGPWLPAPVEEAAPPAAGPEARYDMAESISMAFLVALEALAPTPRAVLLLRDVFDYSVRETAEVLGLSEANVKTTHLRARRRMAGYDARRVRPSPALQEATRQALARFLAALESGDTAQAEALLAEDVSAAADGGGEYAAAREIMRGRTRVATLYVNLNRRLTVARTGLRTLNALPAVVAEFTDPPRGWAPRAVMQCELDERGLIRRIYTVSASRKLAGVR